MTEQFAFRSVHVGHAISAGLAESQMEESLVESFAVDRETGKMLPYHMVISVTGGRILVEDDLQVRVKKPSVYQVLGYVFDDEEQLQAAMPFLSPDRLDESTRRISK